MTTARELFFRTCALRRREGPSLSPEWWGGILFVVLGGVLFMGAAPTTTAPSGVDHARAVQPGMVYAETRQPGLAQAAVVPTLLTPASGAQGISLAPTLTWSDTGAFLYGLQLSTDPGFSNPINQSAIPTSSFVQPGLAPGTTYYWRVRARITPTTWTAYSAPFSFTTRPPSVPAGLSPASTCLAAAPLLSANPVPEATSYDFELYGGPAGALLWSAHGLGVPTTHPPGNVVSPGRSYRWRIRACAGASCSDWASQTFNIPPAPPLLTSPADGATAGTDPPQLTWIRSDGADRSVVTVSRTSDFTSVAYQSPPLSGTILAVPALTRGATYYWRVRVFNDACQSAESLPRSFVTLPAAPAAPVPSEPADDAAGLPSHGLVVRWSAPGGATSQELQLSTDAAFGSFIQRVALAGTASHHTLPPLQYATRYYWRVQGCNAGGCSPWSVRRFTTQPPPAPTSLTPAGGCAGPPLAFNWGPVSGASRYEFELYQGPTLVASDAGLTVDLKHSTGLPLSPGLAYRWQVRACHGTGCSAWSGASFTTPAASPSIQAPAAGAKEVVLPVTLRWAAVGGAVRYVVRGSARADFSVVAFETSATGTSTTIAGLAFGATYYWRVYPDNGTCLGEPGQAYFTTGSPPAPTGLWPDQPSLPDPVIASEFQWAPVTGTTYYQFELYDEATGQRLARDADWASTYLPLFNASLDQLTAYPVSGRRYRWQVRACAAAVCGAWATAHFGTTPLPPVQVAPSNNASDVTTSPRLVWRRADGAGTYRVQLSRSAAFTQVDREAGGLPDTSYTASGLSHSTTYYWRVRTEGSLGTSYWGGAARFTTQPPPRLISVSPSPLDFGVVEPGETVQRAVMIVNVGRDTLRGTYACPPASGVFRCVPSFAASQPFVVPPGKQTSVVIAFTPAEKRVYSDRLRITHNAGNAASPIDHPLAGVGGVPELVAPALMSPPDGLTTGTLTPLLAWREVNGAYGYRLELTNASGAVVKDVFVGGGPGYQSPTLAPSASYRWRVRALRGAEEGPWSAQWRFFTPGPPAPPTANIEGPAGRIYAGRSVAFDGRTSTDNDESGHQIASYAWQGGGAPATGSGATFTTAWSTAGTYTLRLRVTDDEGQADSTTRQVVVTGPPGLLWPSYPSDGTGGHPVALSLSWSPSPVAEIYQVVLALDEGFTRRFGDTLRVSSPSVAVNGLQAGTTYYWRVRACNPAGCGPFWYEAGGRPVRFTTAASAAPIAPPRPVLVGPARGMRGIARRPLLSWVVPEPEGLRFDVQLARTPSFNPLAESASGLSALQHPVERSLDSLTTYYWRVRSMRPAASGPAVWSAWSDTLHFTTLGTLAAEVALVPVAPSPGTPNAHVHFGAAVAISGDVALVGARGSDDYAGAAYIFRRVGGAWLQRARLTAPDAAAGDFFGSAVAIEGEVIVVGAEGQAGATAGTSQSAGAAYVYRYDGGLWRLQAHLRPAAAQQGQRFGHAVAISGDVVAVGAYNDPAGGFSAGAVYVYRYDGSVWREEAVLRADRAQYGDYFGYSVAVRGDVIVVGAYGRDEAEVNVGAAYVFRRAGRAWAEEATLTAFDGAEDAHFGYAVALGGAGTAGDPHVLVGAPGHDGQGINSGAVYLFGRDPTGWRAVGWLLASDGAPGLEFGHSVALGVGRAVVGAPKADAQGEHAGAVYVFKEERGGWWEQSRKTASQGAPGDWLGTAVALDEDQIAAGAPRRGLGAGAAYVFALPPGSSPSVPVLLAPRGAATGVPTRPLLVWRAVPGATRYRLQLSHRATFDDAQPLSHVVAAPDLLQGAALEKLLADTAFVASDVGEAILAGGIAGLAGYVLDDDLATWRRYVWRVRVEQPGVPAGAWSSVGTFETRPPVLRRYYYLTDHLGSVRATVNEKGEVVQSQDYYPFGLTMSGRSVVAGTRTKENFTGHELDDETGLLYAGARYYDPTIGRWTSVDPLAERAPSWSTYRYGFDNPVRFLDTSGRYEVDGHYWTVYLVALLSGRSDAQTLAYWTQYPDDVRNRSGYKVRARRTWLWPPAQIRDHALTGGHPNYERAISKQSIREAENYEEIGRGLHRLGDSYAHVDPVMNLTFVTPIGHLFWGHWPDKIRTRPELYLEYVKDLASIIGDGKIDMFAFDYIAYGGHGTDVNADIIKAEIYMQGGISSSGIGSGSVEAVNKYLAARGRNGEFEIVCIRFGDKDYYYIARVEE